MRIRDLSPKTPVAVHFGADTTMEQTPHPAPPPHAQPVFQFSPEFHRVPSPSFVKKNRPLEVEAAYVITPEPSEAAKLSKLPQPQQVKPLGKISLSSPVSVRGPLGATIKPTASPIASKSMTFGATGTSPIFHRTSPSPSIPSPSLSARETSKIPVPVSATTPPITTAPATVPPTHATSRSSVVSARAKFFEKEIEQLHNPAAKPG